MDAAPPVETTSDGIELDVFAARLRQARLAAGLSQEQLAARLRRPLTKQALSKLETAKSKPRPATLVDLGDALGVSAAWLLSEPGVHLRWLDTSAHRALGKYASEMITAFVASRIEEELRLRVLFGRGHPARIPVWGPGRSLPDAEWLARGTRQTWDLDQGPIHDLIGTIERRGVVVVESPDGAQFGGLAGWANETTPVIVINGNAPPERTRFEAAQAVGHLIMDRVRGAAGTEREAKRFAAELLVPAGAARSELGERRHSVAREELALLGRYWGLGTGVLAHRARALGIISKAVCHSLTDSAGDSDGESQAVEEPRLFRQLLWRAVSEGIMSSKEAERLCPGMRPEPPERLSRLAELARMGPEERAEAIRQRPPDVDMDEVAAWEPTDLADFEAG